MTVAPEPIANVCGENVPLIQIKHLRRRAISITVNIIAGRATDIMLSNVQFSLKMLEPNKISRMFPGIEAVDERAEHRGGLIHIKGPPRLPANIGGS
ncbi:hypothetical protein [Bradyrhizobium sp. RDI18]|uniref:hypothetical protein n=1 Tax=Bradyrhizobium sp. RDI18 TaxID=3367400 RepID=UPI0037157E9B